MCRGSEQGIHGTQSATNVANGEQLDTLGPEIIH